ncbi:MAG: alpha/beta hydrolase [Chloroflexota bacterium]|nr:alpha/beta hydrolase [Chloroflexota bacterium]
MGTSRFAQNELARLSYEVDGPEGGYPVVFQHATLGDHRTIGPLQDVLAADFRLVLPDARGHGASAALQDRSFTVTDMANDLWAVLEAERLDTATAPKLVVIGHGQGAVTAIELARRRPDRLAGMVLIEPDAPALLDGETDRAAIDARENAREIYRRLSEAADRDQGQQAVEGYMSFRWTSGWKDDLNRPRQAAIRRHAGALSPSLDALDRFRILPEELRAIETPTHVVTAGSSPVLVDAIGRRLAETIPGATHRQIGKITLAAPYGSEMMFEVLLPLITGMAAG